MYVPNLQDAINRYATSLAVPEKLGKLHPRSKGNPGNAGALAPAIVLTSISAFEGFVEEFLAILAAQRNFSFGQIAKLVSINNPTVRSFDEKLRYLLSCGEGAAWKAGFALNVYKPPRISESSWIGRQTLTWDEAQTHADGWMQVRHCLTHGLARGFRSEVWPGPLKGTVSASDVLRPRSNGKYSLSIHGAESCAHIYRTCAQRLADEAASFTGLPLLDWSKVHDFEI